MSGEFPQSQATGQDDRPRSDQGQDIMKETCAGNKPTGLVVYCRATVGSLFIWNGFRRISF